MNDFTLKDLNGSMVKMVESTVDAVLKRGNYLKWSRMYVNSATATHVTGYDVSDENQVAFTIPSRLAFTPILGDVVIVIEIDGKTNCFAAFKN